MTEKAQQVEACINFVHASREAIDDLTVTFNKALHDNNIDVESSKIALFLQSHDAYHSATFDG